MSLLDTLAPLRAHGHARTTGLDDTTLARFAASHPQLGEAVEAAAAEFAAVAREFPELLDMDEAAQAEAIQAGFVNFYSADTVNPYVALAARGPWVVTLKGAVLHDSGGYGMLIGPRATKREREKFRKLIEADPRNYMAQPTLALSTAPIVTPEGPSPRHIDLRPFVLSREDVYVTTGGLTRVAMTPGSLVVNSSQGGGAKDTWVVDVEEEA